MWVSDMLELSGLKQWVNVDVRRILPLGNDTYPPDPDPAMPRSRNCVKAVQTALAGGRKPQSGLALADQICKAVTDYVLCRFSDCQSPRCLSTTGIIPIQPFPIEDA